MASSTFFLHVLTWLVRYTSPFGKKYILVVCFKQWFNKLVLNTQVSCEFCKIFLCITIFEIIVLHLIAQESYIFSWIIGDRTQLYFETLWQVTLAQQCLLQLLQWCLIWKFKLKKKTQDKLWCYCHHEDKCDSALVIRSQWETYNAELILIWKWGIFVTLKIVDK